MQFLRTVLFVVNRNFFITDERYSESESQVGNSGSEDNCNFNNYSMISGNSKDISGKNHTTFPTGYAQNGATSNQDINVQFINGPVTNGLEYISTPIKDNLNNSKDSSKSRPTNNAKKSSSKRSRNR